jgi:hypothetical protein
MTKRDEFLEQTKKALAARSGYRCAFPVCDAITVGPSEESDIAISNVGVACHITAAASGPGARRYDPDMSPEERKSINNAIWMCGKHSIEIDRDEVRFTVKKLKHWKKIAEQRAKLAHSHGANYVDKYLRFYINDLTPSSAVIKLENISETNSLIGDAVFDSAIPSVWGRDSAIVARDLIIELSRNCFNHGSATKFELSISTNIIEITYDGNEYNIFTLLSAINGRGGFAVLKEVIEDHKDNIAISYHFDVDNKVIIHRVADFESLKDDLPCVITLDFDSLNEAPDTIDVHHTCGAIYISLPEHFVCSDVHAAESRLSNIEYQGKPVFIVGKDMSKSTIEALTSKFPHLELIHKVS